MKKVGCLVNMEARIVGFLVGSVMEVDLDGVVKKKGGTSGFGLQVILKGYLCVSNTFTL